MEIKFQNQKRPLPVSKAGKSKLRNGANRNNKFVGVRQRPSGRWVAEIKDTTQKIRMWLGTFETAEEAARAYDEAACLLRGSNTRTNFITQVSANSPLASRIKNILNSRKSDESKVKKIIAKSSPLHSSSISSISSSSTCNGEVVSVNTEKTIDTQFFDDAYKPDLSNCIDEYELGGAFGNGYDPLSFNQELVDLPRNATLTNDKEISEFNRIKVERQISASLFAMNGGQECMETLNDCAEAFWDLPPLCSLMFR